MKVTGLSKKALRFTFYDANWDFPRATEDGVLIRFVEIDDWVQVMIEVGEDNTHEQIREAIPLALEWRDRLLKWQGPWIKGGEGQFFYFLNMYHEDRDMSYSELAALVNRRIADKLKEYVAFLKEYEAVKEKITDYWDLFSQDFESSPLAFEHAKDDLISFGFNDEDIKSILVDGINCIKEGLPPFVNGYPITRDRVRQVLRRWRQGKKYKSLKDKEPPEDPE